MKIVRAWTPVGMTRFSKAPQRASSLQKLSLSAAWRIKFDRYGSQLEIYQRVRKVHSQMNDLCSSHFASLLYELRCFQTIFITTTCSTIRIIQIFLCQFLKKEEGSDHLALVITPVHPQLQLQNNPQVMGQLTGPVNKQPPSWLCGKRTTRS